MSYLLDALRKAEQERRLGQPPSLDPGSTMPAPTRGWDRRSYLALLSCSLALALIALALLLTRPEHKPATASTAVVRAVPDTGSAPATPGPRSFDDLGVAPAPPLAAEPAARPAPRPLAPQPAPALPAPQPQPQPQPLKVADAPASVASESGENVDGDEIDLDSQTLHAALDKPAPIAQLREMPLEYRADFPTPSIEVHVYEPMVERRWILSGGRRYREGDTLPQGPKIAEITPDSVIFDYRGQQARVPVGR